MDRPLPNPHGHLIHQKYRPDIDGLRALAVLSVVLFHAFPESLPGGFAGVDIFFVISGYLISTILFASLENNSYSLAEFYLRRIRRIFPALIAVLAACLVLGWCLLLADEFRLLGKHVAGGASFVANFVLWGESGYFDSSAHAKPLLHLWSLAVEEQFYIVWPLLLVLLWRLKWRFATITATVALVSFGINLYLADSDPTGAFYSPLSRFWELMIGGLLAHLNLHHRGLIARHGNSQSILGLALLVASLALLNADRAFPGWWGLLPTLGTFFIISAGPNALVNRYLLSRNGMVWIGLISYPLYLWHWPLISFAHIVTNGDPAKGLLAGLVLVAVLLAWLTYRFVETPVRTNHSSTLAPWSLLGVMALLLLLGLLVFSGQISPRHSAPELAKLVTAEADWAYPGDLEPLAMEGAYIARADATAVTLFLGDSHIQQYVPKIADVVNRNPKTSNSAIVVTDGGCPPIPDVYDDHPSHRNCADVRAHGLELIDRETTKTVVIGGCWNCYFIAEAKPRTPADKYDFYTLVDGEKSYFRDGTGVAAALLRLERFLREISADKKVYLLLDNPIGPAYDPAGFYSGDRIRGLTGNAALTSRVSADPDEVALHRRLAEIAGRAGVETLDPRAMLCDPRGCARLSDSGMPLYRDRDHFRATTVRERASLLDRTLLVHY